MLFALLGVAPGTDVVAHAGGFACGLLIGAIAILNPVLSRSPANFVNALLFAAAAIVPWIFA